MEVILALVRQQPGCPSQGRPEWSWNGFSTPMFNFRAQRSGGDSTVRRPFLAETAYSSRLLSMIIRISPSPII